MTERPTRSRYAAICEASPDAIVLVDGDGQITYANARVEDLFGYAPAELVGEPVERLVPDDAREGHVAQRDAYLAAPETRPMGANLDLMGRRADGSEIPVDISLSPLPGGEGPEVMAAVRDVSDREALRAKYQTILESVPDAVVVTDAATGEVVEVNDQAADWLGYRSGDLVGREYSVCFPADLDYEAVLDRSASDGETIVTHLEDGSRLRVESQDGEQFPVELNAHVFELANQRLVVSVFRDVTTREEYERRLRRLHEVTRELMRADDRQAVADLVADAASEILGYRSNVVRLATPEGVLRPVATTERLDEALGERPDYHVTDASPASRAFASGETLCYDDVTAVDDRERGPVRSAMYLPMGDHGVISVVDAAVAAFDQTDVELASVLAASAETALNRLDDERELERRNERLDEFASVVSHDLRNPLNVAQGWVDVARENHEDEGLDRAAAALDRMADIVDGVLAVVRSGNDVEDVEPIGFGALVEDCWQHVATDDADLSVPVDGVVRADPQRVRHLFENLFRNAVEHGAAASDDPVSVTAWVSEGAFHVADDGPGIPPEDRERVLESGWTTESGNTGLGLKIVVETARAHGWSVGITESDAGGAQFDVTGVETRVEADQPSR